MQDDDVDARSWEDLAFQAKGLRDFEPNQRRRQRGSMGNALKKLAELEAEISRRQGSAEDRIRIGIELWELNKKLGGLSFPWPPQTAGRPKRSTKERGHAQVSPSPRPNSEHVAGAS
jgi:hypothetical protein